MSEQYSSEEIQARCHDLVYQVAYAFYDAPYIILLKLLVQLRASTERSLAEIVGVAPNDLRKYMGMLHVHRLVKRHANKEKMPLSESQARFAAVRGQVAFGLDGKTPMRVRDVFYWYIDYREFADVVKYRIAMMRRGIDDKVKLESGVRGYVCPNCSRTYDPLYVSHLFDMRTNTLQCEDCKHELMEHDPAADSAGGQEKMQAFNIATQPIRDALKRLDGMTLPSFNIMAWIAQNVVTEVVGVERADGEEQKVQVVIGGEEKDLLEKERLQEAQRVQNALPIWHTHSTVTGSATTLGLADRARHQAANAMGQKPAGEDDDDEDDLFEAHFAKMDESGEVTSEDVTPRPDIEAEDILPLPTAVDSDASGQVMVMVNGVAKPLADITDEDEGLMTTEEYEAYADAAAAA